MAIPDRQSLNQSLPPCPAGQQRDANGQCVVVRGYTSYTGTSPQAETQDVQTTGGAEATAASTQQLPTTSELYGGIAQALTGASQANIAASRAETQAAQSQLERQLQQQREDFLRNRQSLQRETFLRGRNVLANLANRGLATSGLQQLGDVQRTIATGQQMSELSRAFEQARQGLTAQQQAAGRAQTAFEAQQRGTLQQQLANLKVQEQQAGITEGERSVAYAESLAQLLSDPTIPQNIKQTLAPLYEQFIKTPAGQEGGLAQQLQPRTLPTQNELITTVSGLAGGTYRSGENNALNTFITGSENLNPNSAFMTALAATEQGQQFSPTVTTKAGYAGLNDLYSVDLGGQTYSLDGKELATLVMSGQITVSPAIAVSILQGKEGNILDAGDLSGNLSDAIARPYLKWLQEQGFISRTARGFSISKEITDLLR